MRRPIPAGDYVKHFDPEIPHHLAWLLAVLEQLVAHEPQALEEGGVLRVLWKAHQAGVAPSPPPALPLPGPPPKPPSRANPPHGTLVRPAGFGHRSGPANVLLLQLRHAPGLRQARSPVRAE
jgi:hypothetical protein